MKNMTEAQPRQLAMSTILNVILALWIRNKPSKWECFCPQQDSLEQPLHCCSSAVTSAYLEEGLISFYAHPVPPYQYSLQKLLKSPAANLGLCLLVKHKSSGWKPLSLLNFWWHGLDVGHLSRKINGLLDYLKQNPIIQTSAAQPRAGLELSPHRLHSGEAAEPPGRGWTAMMCYSVWLPKSPFSWLWTQELNPFIFVSPKVQLSRADPCSWRRK